MGYAEKDDSKIEPAIILFYAKSKRGEELALMCVHFEAENFREILSSFSRVASQRSQFGGILDLKRNAH